MNANYKPSDFEAFRGRCVELKEAGWKQKDIAMALGLTEGWVSQTLKKYRVLGSEGLLARKPPGSLPKLTSEQLSQLVEELKQGAASQGFPGHIWTRSRVNELIGRLLGVTYDPTQVRRILKKLGWNGTPPRHAEARQEGPPAKQAESPAVAGRDGAGIKKKPWMRTASSPMSIDQGSTCSPW